MKKIYLFLIPILIFSCSTSNDDSNNTNITTPTPTLIDGFDRTSLLTFYVDQIINPAYSNLYNKILDLESKVNVFTNQSSSINNLIILRKSWIESYIAWQNVAMFNINLAEEIGLVSRINTYPVNTSLVDLNIQNNITQLPSTNISNIGTTGFAAMGYLLYGIGGDSISTFNEYNNSQSSSNLKQHLNLMINDIKSNILSVKEDWENKRNDFISSTANTATSSLNKLVNDFLQYYEKRVREGKIAIPSGVRTDLNPDETKIESYYYSPICKDLLVEAFKSVKRFYYGKSFPDEVKEIGLESYLNHLDKQELITAINNQITNIDNKISLLENDFKSQLINDNNQMFEVFYEMQGLVVYLKTDMLSAFNMSTDYIDNDGD